MKTQDTLPAIDLTQLRSRCNATIDELIASIPNVQTFTNEWGDRHWYIDNGSPILGVAHLDTVRSDPAFDYRTVKPLKGMKKDALIWSAQLDDRLGAWLILDYLPLCGLTFDVLLTENEEGCQSTAYDFTPRKEYRWMFMFDRAGNDVVMYQYEDDASEKLLEQSGARLGNGTYSCIADLEHVGAKGFNWGCGYENAHYLNCYTRVRTLSAQVRRFAKFYHANKDTRLIHIPDPDPEYDRGLLWSKHYPTKFSAFVGTCDYCGMRGDVNEVKRIYALCDRCLDAWEITELEHCHECGAFIGVSSYVYDLEICDDCAHWNTRYANHLAEKSNRALTIEELQDRMNSHAAMFQAKDG